MGTWFYAEQPSACSLDPRRADGNPLLGSIGLLICRRWRELFFFAVIPFPRCGGAPQVASQWTLAGLLFCRLGQQGWGGLRQTDCRLLCESVQLPVGYHCRPGQPISGLDVLDELGNSKVGGSGSVHAFLGMSVYVSVTSTLGTEDVAWSHPW